MAVSCLKIWVTISNTAERSTVCRKICVSWNCAPEVPPMPGVPKRQHHRAIYLKFAGFYTVKHHAISLLQQNLQINFLFSILLIHLRSLLPKGVCSLNAGVAKLADALDLGSSAARHGGSSPSARTNKVTVNSWFLPAVNRFLTNYNYLK